MPVEGRDLSSRRTQHVARDLEIGQPINSRRVFRSCRRRCTRKRRQKPGIAQCRSNKGAPGVDGQDFADVDAYGVQRWLGELTLALRSETYRPAPIRRVYIPKANGKLRPLGISTLRDRVCMTAAMLVLEPIF